jgi:periodic tryptophan protein 1
VGSVGQSRLLCAFSFMFAHLKGNDTSLVQISLENGMVVNFDVRALPSDLDQPSPARFTIAAHDGAACALDVNTHIRGCLATAGTDKMVKIWNIQGDGETGGKRQVSLVAGRDLGLVSPLKYT